MMGQVRQKKWHLIVRKIEILHSISLLIKISWGKIRETQVRNFYLILLGCFTTTNARLGPGGGGSGYTMFGSLNEVLR